MSAQVFRLADYRRRPLPPGAPATVRGLPLSRPKVSADSEARVVLLTRKVAA